MLLRLNLLLITLLVQLPPLLFRYCGGLEASDVFGELPLNFFVFILELLDLLVHLLLFMLREKHLTHTLCYGSFIKVLISGHGQAQFVSDFCDQNSALHTRNRNLADQLIETLRE